MELPLLRDALGILLLLTTVMPSVLTTHLMYILTFNLWTGNTGIITGRHDEWCLSLERTSYPLSRYLAPGK